MDVLSRVSHSTLFSHSRHCSVHSYRHVREAGLPRYSLVAFASVYLFYCYPDRQRPRISQLLVLPHYQRRGHGGKPHPLSVMMIFVWS